MGLYKGSSKRCSRGLILQDYFTPGRASTPTSSWVEGWRIALKAIHTPPITNNRAPTGTVSGVLWGPIVAAYTRPSGYINTAAPAQRAPAHLGSVSERHSQEHVANKQEHDD